MRKYGLFLALAILVLTNIAVLANVARNRSGEPGSVLELTERELPLSAYYGGTAAKENTGISLRLNWNRLPFYGKFLQGRIGIDQYSWIDKAKLEEMGFDCSLPLADPQAATHYGKMLPKKAYVVLEYEGKAWNEYIEHEQRSIAAVAERAVKGAAADKDLKEANEEYDRLMKTASRLFAVDAGRDPVILRQRYPDRSHSMIVAAKVRLQYRSPYDDGRGKKELPRLSGYLDEILVDILYVPKPLSTALESLVLKSRHQERPRNPYSVARGNEPAYRVTIHNGVRFEPWVAGIQAIEQ